MPFSKKLGMLKKENLFLLFTDSCSCKLVMTYDKFGFFVSCRSKMLSQLSDGLWGIIRSEDGMKNEIRETVQSVYTTLSNPGGVQEGPSTREAEHNIPFPTSSSLLHLGNEIGPSSKQKQELIYVQENKGEAACSSSTNNRVSYTDNNNNINCDDDDDEEDEEDPELPPGFA